MSNSFWPRHSSTNFLAASSSKPNLLTQNFCVSYNCVVFFCYSPWSKAAWYSTTMMSSGWTLISFFSLSISLVDSSQPFGLFLIFQRWISVSTFAALISSSFSFKAWSTASMMVKSGLFLHLILCSSFYPSNLSSTTLWFFFFLYCRFLS